MPRIRSVSSDDRMSLVEHLDELRARLVVCLAACVAALLPRLRRNQLLEIAPLAVLYELSVVPPIAFGRPAERLEGAPQGS